MKRLRIELIVNYADLDSSPTITQLANNAHPMRSPQDLVLVLVSSADLEPKPMIIKPRVSYVTLVIILLTLRYVCPVLLVQSLEEMERPLVLFAHLVTKPTPLELVV